MNEVIDLNEMPAMFGMCNVKECALAETCLRQIVYPAVAKKKAPFLSMLNPEWLAVQKGSCKHYLKNEKVRRAFGFITTLNAIPSGKVGSFRASLISRMGRKRYYQTRKGEVMLTEAEAQLIVKQANRLGVELEEYFDRYKYVLLWG